MCQSNQPTMWGGDAVFDIVTAQNQRGIITSAYMLRRPDPNDYCIDAIQFTKADLTGLKGGEKDDDKDDDKH